MTDLWAQVSNMWAHGVMVGPHPDENCDECPHVWGDHVMHAIGDDPRDGGMTSCPLCDCVCTWSAYPTAQVCQWGRKLRNPAGVICPEMAGGILVVFDGEKSTEIPLCPKHSEELGDLTDG